MEKGKAREGEGKSVMGTFRRVCVPRDTVEGPGRYVICQDLTRSPHST
jgi:hypothetical protein